MLGQTLPDAEKAVSSPISNNIADKVESNQSSDDASSNKADDVVEKEKEGSLKDYFRIFRYADGLDIALYSLSLGGAVAVGASLPLMTLVFGSSTSTFNDFSVGQGSASQFTSRINHLVLYFVYLFIARFIIGYVATLCICIAATRTTCAMRKAFLESTLRQEVGHFDNQSNGSAATQVTTSQ